MSSIKKLSQSVCNTIDSKSVGLDPVTILTLVTGIITTIMKCREEENVSEAEAKEAFHAKYESNPRQVENRIKHQVRIQSRKSGKVLRSSALDEVTQKTISGLLGADDETVMSCCSEA